MATVSYLSVARARRQRMHSAAGKVHLASSLREDPGAGLLASNAGPAQPFSLRREVLKLTAVLVLLGATLLLMPGCGPEPRRVEAAGLTCFARTGICRFHDAEASVTCWTTGDSRGGVACLRDLPTAEGRP